jgi:hypothetical protein
VAAGDSQHAGLLNPGGDSIQTRGQNVAAQHAQPWQRALRNICPYTAAPRLEVGGRSRKSVNEINQLSIARISTRLFKCAPCQRILVNQGFDRMMLPGAFARNRAIPPACVPRLTAVIRKTGLSFPPLPDGFGQLGVNAIEQLRTLMMQMIHCRFSSLVNRSL